MKEVKRIAERLEDGSYYIKGEDNALVLLQNIGVQIPASCGGRGTCGKCRIVVKGEGIPISAEDAKVFNREELDGGFRLACRFNPAQGAIIEVPEQTARAEKQYTAVDGFVLSVQNGEDDENEEQKGSTQREGSEEVQSKQQVRRIGAAIDIGTTTLAFSLVDLERGTVLCSCSAMNPQRRHGADVMSRIGAADQGMAAMMKEEILEAAADGLERLIKDWKNGAAQTAETADGMRSVTANGKRSETVDGGMSELLPEKIAVAGNTVMLHLFRGYDVSELGRIPFKPVTLEEELLTADEVFGEKKPSWLPGQTGVGILPGISAFVGADITAGLYSCRFFERSDRAFLLDLGTNGEMGLISDGVLYTASTAAGPAFEGGNISCGVGSIEGAVSDFSLARDENGDLVRHVTTIGGKKPAGLCGTGLIALISALKKEELMDEMGLLDDEYFDDGFVFAGEGEDALSITQKDIRELQLAKGAIRAGISILLARAGLEPEDVDQIYLAGGFGFFLDTEKAMDICLLPTGFRGKITAAGNSCIGGLVRYLTKGSQELAGVFDRSRIREINLAEQPDFYDKYTEAMAFEEEMF